MLPTVQIKKDCLESRSQLSALPPGQSQSSHPVGETKHLPNEIGIVKDHEGDAGGGGLGCRQ